MNPLKTASVEHLHHFSCFECEQWWSIADFKWNEYDYLFCPKCGTKQSLPDNPLTGDDFTQQLSDGKIKITIDEKEFIVDDRAILSKTSVLELFFGDLKPSFDKFAVTCTTLDGCHSDLDHGFVLAEQDLEFVIKDVSMSVEEYESSN